MELGVSAAVSAGVCAGVLTGVSATSTEVADVATTALLEVLVAAGVGVVAAGAVVSTAGVDVLLLLVPAAPWRADRMAS